MLRWCHRDEIAESGQVMPLANSIGAAPSVTRAHAGPKVGFRFRST